MAVPDPDWSYRNCIAADPVQLPGAGMQGSCSGAAMDFLISTPDTASAGPLRKGPQALGDMARFALYPDLPARSLLVKPFLQGNAGGP